MKAISGKVVRSNFRNMPVSFFVENEADVIQRHHARGSFYEIEELEIIEKFFPKGGVFLDIGANIGNHTIFAAQHLSAQQCITVEANPSAIEILNINIDLNNLRRRVDASLLGVGFSNRTHTATLNVPKNNNLGGTKLELSNESGEIRCVRGDDLVSRRPIDLIKLDVEGMEIAVLDGLAQTINDNRPMIFVEVENSNRGALEAFKESYRYTVRGAFQRYNNNENFMLVPIEASVM